MVAVLTGCAAPSRAAMVSPSPSATEARTALGGFLDACDIDDDDAQLSDDGHTVYLHWLEPSDPLSTSDASCILHKSRIPAAIEHKLNMTRPEDGTQHATWGPYKATWTYTPATGADLTLTDQ